MSFRLRQTGGRDSHVTKLAIKIGILEHVERRLQEAIGNEH